MMKIMFAKLKLIIFNFAIGLIILSLIVACSPPISVKQSTSTPKPKESLPTYTQAPEIEYLFPQEIFTYEGANTVPPEDVISEVYFNMSGGGDGYRGDCFGEGPKFPVAAFYNQETVIDKKELLLPSRLVVCGWELAEQVDLSITTPDGKSFHALLTATDGGYRDDFEINRTEFVYFPSINDKEGVYSFIFTGKSGSVKYSIEYFISSTPKAYKINFRDMEMEKTSSNINLSAILDKDISVLVLSGYAPNERIRLFSYFGGGFQSWQEYKVNQRGLLTIQLKDYFAGAVVGDVSLTEIHPPSYPSDLIIFYDKLDPIYLTCKDTVPTRLKIGDYSFVSTRTDTSNRLRSDATTSSEMLDKLSPGTIMEIVDGPKCADGILWWKVKGVSRSFEGWTGEGDTEYWLDPCYSKEYCY